MSEISEEEQIKRAEFLLNELSKKLKNIEQEQNRGINIFNAVGMQTQEIKHSAFLSWLLNPEQSHKLGNLFLKKLTEKLNLQVEDFLASDDITVETEKLLDGSESRIDIYIQSEKSKTLIIIENKVFTTSHDNQLERYEKLVEGRIGWNRTFIYLTPKGGAPTEKGDNWLLFSYSGILEIIKELLQKTTNQKLKYLLKDYIEMVDDNILKNNKTIENLCKKIRREHKEAIEILLNYTDNIEEVANYCKKWFKDNIPNITIRSGKTTFEFYTQPMKAFLEKNNSNMVISSSGLWKCRCVFGYGENVPICISLQKDTSEEWDWAQSKIINSFEPDKKVGNKYFTLNEFSVELLSVEGRRGDFENIVEELDDNLKEFAIKLKLFEDKLAEIQ